MPSTPESLDITTGLNEKLSAIEASPSTQLSQKILSALFFFVFFYQTVTGGAEEKTIGKNYVRKNCDIFSRKGYRESMEKS